MPACRQSVALLGLCCASMPWVASIVSRNTLDGNGNGVRAADIAAGADPELAGWQFLRDHFRGVSFGLRANVPDVNGSMSSAAGDGVRIGTEPAVDART